MLCSLFGFSLFLAFFVDNLSRSNRRLHQNSPASIKKVKQTRMRWDELVVRGIKKNSICVLISLRRSSMKLKVIVFHVLSRLPIKCIHRFSFLYIFSTEMSNRPTLDDNERILHLLQWIEVIKFFVEIECEWGRRILSIWSDDEVDQGGRYRHRSQIVHPQFNIQLQGQPEEDDWLLRGIFKFFLLFFISFVRRVHVPFSAPMLTRSAWNLGVFGEKLETMTMTMMKFVECWKIIYMFPLKLFHFSSPHNLSLSLSQVRLLKFMKTFSKDFHSRFLCEKLFTVSVLSTHRKREMSSSFVFAWVREEAGRRISPNETVEKMLTEGDTQGFYGEKWEASWRKKNTRAIMVWARRRLSRWLKLLCFVDFSFSLSLANILLHPDSIVFIVLSVRYNTVCIAWWCNEAE